VSVSGVDVRTALLAEETPRLGLVARLLAGRAASNGVGPATAAARFLSLAIVLVFILMDPTPSLASRL